MRVPPDPIRPFRVVARQGLNAKNVLNGIETATHIVREVNRSPNLSEERRLIVD